ncbi:unnamed protein product [uncultured bacterium]|nr:unnamed protein product [uncultured bacterium]
MIQAKNSELYFCMEILRAIGGVEKLRVGWMRDLGLARLAALAPLVLEQAVAGDQTARRIRDRAVEHLAALISVIAGPDTPLFAGGGLVSPLRLLLSKKAGRPVLEPNGDALNRVLARRDRASAEGTGASFR